MTGHIELSINGEVLHRIEIVNEGPVSGVTDPAGEHRYRWTHHAGPTGFVVHRRGAGMVVLSAKVLDRLGAHVTRVDWPPIL